MRMPLMRVLLDEQPCAVTATTVAEAVQEGLALVEKSGRMIVEVMVDGEPWTQDSSAEGQSSPTMGEEVHLITADPTELVSEVFADAINALEMAGEKQREAGELLESGNTTEAMKLLGEALTIWQSVQKAVLMGSEVVGIDLDRTTPQGREPGAIIRALADRLARLRSALNDEDPLGLSDTLMYDLPEVVEQWRTLLGELRSQVIGDL